MQRESGCQSSFNCKPKSHLINDFDMLNFKWQWCGWYGLQGYIQSLSQVKKDIYNLANNNLFQ